MTSAPPGSCGPGSSALLPRTGRSANWTSARPRRPPASPTSSPRRTCPRAWSSRSGWPWAAPISAPTCSRCSPPTMVRYVGEPLAVVVGDDPYACEDAAELVDIDIDELPAVTDARAAQDQNTAAELTLGYGDTEAAFRDARHVVGLELAIGRHTGVPLEPRCLLAVPDPGTGGARHLRHDQGPGVQPRPAGGHARPGRDAHPRARHRRGRRVRDQGRVLPRGLPHPLAGHQARPPGQVGRGPRRAPDGGEPFPPAVPPHRRRLRRRRPDHRPAGRHRARQRRLLPHARRRGTRTDGGDAARSLPDSRLPGPGPGGAHQQDPVRHLPGPGPVRGHVGPRAPARRGRHPARPRSRPAARAQSPDQGRDAAQPPHHNPRHRPDPGHRRLPGPARRGGQRRPNASATAPRPRPRPRTPPRP